MRAPRPRRRLRVLVASTIVATIVVASRLGVLARVRLHLLSLVSDHAWKVSALATRMEDQWRRRVAVFEEYEVAPGDVVMVGDSITEMTDWSQLLPGVAVHNQGIGGDDTDGLLRRVHLVTRGEPGKVFVMIGTNDLGKGVHPPEVIVDHAAQIIDAIREQCPSTEVHLQSVLPRRRKRAAGVAAVNRGLEQVARELSLIHI